MAYTKHNFSDGSVLHASALNQMEDQIALNEAAAAGKYSKPQGGIPAGDLTGEVQAAIAKAAAIGAVWTLKGTVASAGLLPGSGNTIGDVYYVSDESVGYVWINDGTVDRWEQLGATVDTSAFMHRPAIVTTGTSITLADNTVYKLTGVSTLTITFPGSGSYHSHIRLTTAASGTITITLPAGALFIGAVPSFGNGETWELDIEECVIVAGKAASAS